MVEVAQSTISNDEAKRRRGHGEGSFVERDGKIQAQVSVNGKRLSQTFHNRAEAKKWARKTLSDADQGMLPPDGAKVTVGAFLDRWLAAMKPSIKPSTYAVYRFAIRDHILPTVGAMKLLNLRADHVQNLYAAKLDSGLSTRTVLIVHRLLHKALKDGIRWRLLSRNVTDAVIAPKVRRAELSVWSSDDAMRFLRETVDDRLNPAYTISLYCGLRAGELVGLRWDDVDLVTGRLQIQRTIQRVRGVKGLVTGDPKSASSRRQIVLPATALEALRRRRIQQKKEQVFATSWQETGYVFTTTIGTVFEPRNYNRTFTAAVKRIGLPMIRVHDMRHTCATLLLSRGVHPKIVQELLGHSQISLTMDTYSHVLPTMQEDAARTMERVLSSA